MVPAQQQSTFISVSDSVEPNVQKVFKAYSGFYTQCTFISFHTVPI